jgi:hypothetical protein
MFIEPSAFDVEELDACEARDRKRIYRKLSDWLVRTRVGFVIENVHGAVSDLEKVDVTGDRPLGRVPKVAGCCAPFRSR